MTERSDAEVLLAHALDVADLSPLADRPVGGVAVLIPCRDEATTVGRVVRDFRAALPGAAIYVYDNGSGDETALRARAAGAVVRRVATPGKGNVVRRMLADVDAAVYVLVDGDDTYDAGAAPAMVDRLLTDNLDMVVGSRIDVGPSSGSYRRGHRAGNRLLSRFVAWLFGGGSADMLSGYRVMSRRFTKSFPAFSSGFEVETEMTVHALDLSLPFSEVPTAYRARPADSSSKLRTVTDGVRIVRLIFALCRDYRPLRFFGTIAAAASLGAVVCAFLGHGYLHAWTPATFGLVGCMAVVAVATTAGVILDSLRRGRRELKRMMYLALPTQPAASSDACLDLRTG